MNCRDMMEFLMDYLDDGLSGGEKQSFEEHLEVCPECVDYLHSYGKTVQFTQLCRQESDNDNEATPEMPEELVAAILAARRG